MQIKINSKTIIESCKAIGYYANAIIISCLFLLCPTLNAQNFEKINFLNKSSTQVKKGMAEYILVTVSNYKSGEMFTSYYSKEYGTIVYIFDVLNTCTKIMIYSQPSRVLLINKDRYDLKIEIDNHKIVYSIQNK